MNQALTDGVPHDVEFEVVHREDGWEATALVGAPLINDRIVGFGSTPVTALINAEIKLLRRLKRAGWVMGARQQIGCPECGLLHPCKTCGGGARPKLGIVRDAQHWTREQLLDLVQSAFTAGRDGDAAKFADILAGILK